VTERKSSAVDGLTAEEQGCLLGMSLMGLDDTILARLSVEYHETCRAAWQDLRAFGRSTRAQVLARWMVETNAPFPPGMERLHPSWIAQVVASEPKDLWPALLSGVPGVQAVTALLEYRIDEKAEAWPSQSVAELQRCAFARLAPLGVGPSGPVGAVLCRLSCEELLAEVIRRGSALHQELEVEGEPSLWAVAGRLPDTLGRRWVKW
jgi:hypothetical protein